MAYEGSLSISKAAENRAPASFRGRAQSAALAVRPRTPCRGFTLIEVVLVLAILVAIAALSIPVMSGTFERSQLRNGGEVVQSAWARTRLAAMETGQPYLFRCQMKSGQFQMVSLAELVSTNGAVEQPTAKDLVKEDSATSWRLDFNQLPSGVVFASGEFAETPQVAAMFSGLLDANWSRPILFQPDGTCNDASVLLSNEKQMTVRVTLRGMTGTARLGDVGAEALP